MRILSSVHTRLCGANLLSVRSSPAATPQSETPPPSPPKSTQSFTSSSAPELANSNVQDSSSSVCPWDQVDQPPLLPPQHHLPPPPQPTLPPRPPFDPNLTPISPRPASLPSLLQPHRTEGLLAGIVRIRSSTIQPRRMTSGGSSRSRSPSRFSASFPSGRSRPTSLIFFWRCRFGLEARRS